MIIFCAVRKYKARSRESFLVSVKSNSEILAMKVTIKKEGGEGDRAEQKPITTH